MTAQAEPRTGPVADPLEARSRGLRGVDPLVKMAGAVAWTAAGVAGHDPTPLAVLGIGTTVLLAAAGAFRRVRAAGAGLLGLGALAGVHWGLGGDPEEILATVLRLYAVTGGPLALMLTTDPARLLRALGRLPLPPGILLGLTLMWRSVPALRAELAAIRLACRIEGVAVGLAHPVRLFRHLLVPLAFGMVGFADDMTLALQTRGIGLSPGPRPGRRPASLGWTDRGFLLFVLFFAGVPLLWRLAGLPFS
ncbi:MAG: energy-coupling factor transporter transmembrane component T family protein [Desulfococcaceae bacterium]